MPDDHGHDADEEMIAPIEVPIDGVLDLHTFHPRDVKELLSEYVRECAARGIFELRIIHGKGRGAMRRTVHALLERMPEVHSYRLADEVAGGWGATLVVIGPKSDDEP